MRYDKILETFKKRRLRIEKLAKSGLSHAEIAKRMKVSRARIYQILTPNGK